MTELIYELKHELNKTIEKLIKEREESKTALNELIELINRATYSGEVRDFRLVKASTGYAEYSKLRNNEGSTEQGIQGIHGHGDAISSEEWI